MHNIVIFDTAIGTSNLGDEIIFESVLNEMRTVLDSNFTLRLGTHITNFTLLQMMRKNMKVRYFQSADWKLICGTNLVAQNRIGKINNQWQIPISNISVYKNSVLVGAGTTDNTLKMDPLAKWLYRSVLSKDYKHSVRDDHTKELLALIGIESINTGCPTLWNLTEDACSRIPRKKSDYSIISLSGYSSQTDEKIDRCFLHIMRKNYRKLWFWVQTTEDEKYLQSLGFYDYEPIYSLKAFRDIASSKKPDYVGTRLHGGVYALNNGCRSIVIGIDHRATGFQKSNNLKVIQRTEIADQLEEMIQSEFDTEIRIDQKAIHDFKEQFLN